MIKKLFLIWILNENNKNLKKKIITKFLTVLLLLKRAVMPCSQLEFLDS